MSSVPGVLKIQAYSERLENEEREKLLSYISLLEDKNHKKEIVWQMNRNKNGTKFDKLNLKSNLKKNNVFVKKLKQFSSGQLETVLKDIENLNLTKFLSEIADALVYSNLKIADISSAVKISSELHLVYLDFSCEYLECWKKHLNFNENSPVFNRRKLKIDFIFFCALIVSGIFNPKDSLEFLSNTLNVIVREDLTAHKNIDIVYNFCKYCAEDIIGAVPKSIRILSAKYDMEVPRGRLISIDFQDKVKKLLKEYHDSLILSLTSSFETISNLEKRYNDHLLEKGDIHPDKLKQLESLKKEFSTLKCYTDKISNMLDFSKPILKKNVPENSSCDIHGMTAEQLTQEVWGDEETEKFYCDLPCVEEYLLLSSKDSDPNFEMNDNQPVTEESLDEDIKAEDLLEDVDDSIQEQETCEKDEDNGVVQLNIFLKSLSNCLSKNVIDNAAIEFLLTYNSKQARNKLVQYVQHLPRTRYDLFPFICRFLAIVSQAHPMIAKRIADIYYKQFRFLIVKKDQIKVENKIKNVKIISELIKFKLFSNIYGLYCLKLLLHDFSHHHIEMACVFLENCGKYLYFSQETHLRTKSYLEQILARKNNVILDLKYKHMIDSIYHMIIPTIKSSITSNGRKQRSLMHEFIRHLIYTKLDLDSVGFVRGLVEKLHWDDPKTERYIIQCLSHPNEIKYNKINCMAVLVQDLMNDYEEQIVQVIDNVLEDIKLGLEMMDKALYQRRIAMVTFLGELYNHCDLIDVDTIFKTLYTIITHCVHFESSCDLSRVALVLTVLDVCHFSQDLYETELHYFVMCFQHFFLYKSQQWKPRDSRFPLILLKQRYEETLRKLYPKKKLFECLEESMTAVEKIFHIISRKYNLNFNSMNYLILNLQVRNHVESTIGNVKGDEEDDSLIEAYDKLVVHSVKERTDATLTHVKDITIPVSRKAQGDGETQFFMLVRKPNHKPLLKEISIPPDSDIVTTFKTSQKSREAEMNRVKQITLQYNKRLQQESD